MMPLTLAYLLELPDGSGPLSLSDSEQQTAGMMMATEPRREWLVNLGPHQQMHIVIQRLALHLHHHNDLKN